MTRVLNSAGQTESAINLELRADELLALSARRDNTSPAPRGPARRSASSAVLSGRDVGLYAPRLALAVGLTLAAAFAAVVAYRTSNDERQREVVSTRSPDVEFPVATMPSERKADRPPVRFTNPFDRTEVFEFPPDTTEADARAAVAKLLIERARERGARYERVAVVRRSRATVR